MAWSRGSKNAIRDLHHVLASLPCVCLFFYQFPLRSGQDGTSSSRLTFIQLCSFSGLKKKKKLSFSSSFIRSLKLTLTGLTWGKYWSPSMHSIQGTEFVDWPELGPGSNLSLEVNLGPLKACGLNRARLSKKRRTFCQNIQRWLLALGNRWPLQVSKN